METAFAYLATGGSFVVAMAFILYHDRPEWAAWTAFLSPVRFRNWGRKRA